MQDRNNYFIYYAGGSCGNFIANLCMLTLSQGRMRPVFSPSGNSHQLYTAYLKQIIPQWPSDPQQLVSRLAQHAEPWLVFCALVEIKDQLDCLPGKTSNLIILHQPRDQLELLFNHYYKNHRPGPMDLATDTVDVYHRLRDQGVLPAVDSWHELTREQNWLLLQEQQLTTLLFDPPQAPGDCLLNYRDIMDQPEKVMQTLSQYLGQDLEASTGDFYYEYLELNRRLKELYWLA